ncbi:MAG: PIN domain-containing protein [Chitinophagales bacterium]|nr:PIN domain-containing protein [Chitinophagales bacterium]
MKRVFIDSNIFIDYLQEPQPRATFVTSLFELAELGSIYLFGSAIAFSHTHYVVRRSLGDKLTIELLKDVLRQVKLIAVDEEIIRNALHLPLKDFEDAIQYECALKVTNLYAIITHNQKDFQKSIYPVMSAEQFIKTINASL